MTQKLFSQKEKFEIIVGLAVQESNHLEGKLTRVTTPIWKIKISMHFPP